MSAVRWPSGHRASRAWYAARNSAATTAVIDRLEQAGQLRRERDSTDRRRVRLVVSDQAMALGWSFFGPLIDGMLTAMRSFTDAELDTVTRFLTAIAGVTASVPRPGPRDAWRSFS